MVGGSNPRGPTDLTLFLKKLAYFQRKVGYFDSKILFIACSRRDSITRMSIHVFWNSQSMPVDDGRVRDVILQPHLDVLTLLHPENGTQIGIVQRLDGFAASFLY